MFKGFLNKVREIRQLRRDSQLGRILVGVDRSGNSYYQYVDPEGYETKRECQYVNVFSPNHPSMMDPAWEDWLRKKRLEPYSQEEMDEIYRRADATRKRGLASDQAEMDMMNTFRRSDSYNRSDKKDFNPKTWSFEDEDKNENSNKKK